MANYPPGHKTGFYRPEREDVRIRTSFDNVDPETGEVMPSMTRQSEMEACDIHNVLRQFSQQGFEQLVREKASQGQYADLPDSIDYQESLNLVLAAQASFSTLPSQVRERFHNNPAEFLEFLTDPANQDEAIRLGLATDNRPVETVQKVEIVGNPEKTPVQGNGGVDRGVTPYRKARSAVASKKGPLRGPFSMADRGVHLEVALSVGRAGAAVSTYALLDVICAE